MNVRYDPKGKYFTEVVSKVPVVAWIQTTRQRIRGTVFLHPDNRLLDELNQAPEYLAVTDATVFEEDRQWKTEFLALHRSQLIWVTPEADMEDPASSGGKPV
jgi:hypothetical protein